MSDETVPDEYDILKKETQESMQRVSAAGNQSAKFLKELRKKIGLPDDSTYNDILSEVSLLVELSEKFADTKVHKRSPTIVATFPALKSSGLEEVARKGQKKSDD